MLKRHADPSPSPRSLNGRSSHALKDEPLRTVVSVSLSRTLLSIMDDQDRQNTMAALEESTEWTIWKTKDKRWTSLLRQAEYHQLLDIHKNKQSECWGFKIKGWWRRGDIRTTKPKKSFECWVKTATGVSKETKKTLMEALTAPHRNAGKDEYIVDLEGNEKLC